ncbi:ribonuclease Z [Parapedobacter tibetensis]|uniref:ribonuclease Z n=1 Tax=Parapedobacter tibetensis TaxID=2972951 RepID=UPI00214DA0CA|nr:ribonuclease Z [Parapedobacter tibetensis]
MKFEVLILGCSSATPIYGRHPTSQLINLNEQLYLIDCGEGTQIQLVKYGIKSNRIKHIFISHLHGDHYLGLIGLISSMHLIGRKEELHLYAPPALEEIIRLQFLHSQTVLRYPLHFHATQDQSKEVIFENGAMEVSSFPLSHRIACTGFRFDEKKRLPSINKEKVGAIGIPNAQLPMIKRGHDYIAPDGTVYPWQDLTNASPAPRSYAYCSDTVKTASYLPNIRGVDLLYHEATFLHDMHDRAVDTFHTTALQAGEVATEVGAKKLVIGHYSARYRDLRPLLQESKTTFAETQLAQEGIWFSV